MIGFEEILFRVFIVQNFGKDQSLIILKNHHVITDGIGSNLLLADMLDKKCVEMSPVFKTWSLYEMFAKHILGFLLIPYTLLKLN